MAHRWTAAAILGAVLLTACGSGAKPTGQRAPGPPPLSVVAAPAPSTTEPATEPTTTTEATSTTAPTTTTTTTPTSTRPAAQPGSTAAPRVTTACPATLAGRLAWTGTATQLITVDAPSASSTTATVTAWQRAGACWVPAAGPWTGWTGRSGLAAHHVEGDGTTPMGAYGIGPVMYGIAPNPGVRYRYHQLVCGDWWDEDPASPGYNTFQAVGCSTTPPFHGNSEALWQQTVAYQRFAVVNYNTGPITPGAGSAIFLHDNVGNPTDGCVSLPPAQLDTVLRWLNPAAAPLIIIGTDASIGRY